MENETVWLTQKLMAELFQTSKQNIGQHLKNIFADSELNENSVVKKFFTTATDGKQYSTAFYNLDAIISVGYRVQSHVATRFRQWATRHIREYIVKGFVLDDERLKNLVFAEGQAMRRVPMTMQDWIRKLDGFLGLNDREILTHAGKVSHELARESAELVYEQFNQMCVTQADSIEGAFEKAIQGISVQKGKP